MTLSDMPRIELGRPATYDDLVALPENLVGEIVDDELWASPRPAPKHSRAEFAVSSILGPAFQFGETGPGGWQFLVEPELHLASDVLVPDIAAWRADRMPVLPRASFVATAPDWVCEVLSPSTARLDREKKLHIYAEHGVGHAWLVDPIPGTLEVLRREQHGDNAAWMLVATHAGDAVARLEPFEAIEFQLSLLWAE